LRIITKILRVLPFFILLACGNSNSNQVVYRTEKCDKVILKELKNSLSIVSEKILINNPVLLKNTSIDPVEIDQEVKGEIDSIFSKYCFELREEIEFERFALIYMYNFKYNQYKCCAPGESEVIGESFMNANHQEKKDAFGIVMKYLLEQNGFSKENIVYNGFAQSQLSFSKTSSKYLDDIEVNKLIEKANLQMEKAYELESGY